EDVREIEVAILGNAAIETSELGEVRHNHDFLTYDAKYRDPDSTVVIPASVPRDVATKVRQYAAAAYEAIGCEGLARVDFLLDRVGSLYVLEINTMPGLTPKSMVPRLWEATGVSYGALIDRLVSLARDRHAQNQAHTGSSLGAHECYSIA